MSDLKRECPGCHARTSGVGNAIEDGDPCPYCGYDLSQEPTLAEHRFNASIREAKAEALTAAAVDVVNGGQVPLDMLALRPTRPEIARWLRSRAAEYRSEGGDRG